MHWKIVEYWIIVILYIAQIPQEQNSSSYQDVYPPSSTNEFTNPMTTPTEVGVAPPPPPPVNIPIYNPMAKRSTPLVVSGFDINPSLVFIGLWLQLFLDSTCCKETCCSSSTSTIIKSISFIFTS